MMWSCAEDNIKQRQSLTINISFSCTYSTHIHIHLNTLWGSTRWQTLVRHWGLKEHKLESLPSNCLQSTISNQNVTSSYTWSTDFPLAQAWKMVLQRVRKRGSYLCVEEQKARETPGVCEVLWKMVTENSLWESMLYKCITILTLQILKLDVKQHSLAQSSIYLSKRVKNVGDREKNNTQPLSLDGDAINSWKDIQVNTSSVWTPSGGGGRKNPQRVRMSVLETGLIINHLLWFSYKRQQKGLIICCDEVIRKGITEKAE